MYKRQGFTLLEIVLVMVLISILLVGSVVGYTNYISMGRDSTAKADLQRTMLDLVRMNNLGGTPEFIVTSKMIPELENLGYTVNIINSTEVEDYSGLGVPPDTGSPLPEEMRVTVTSSTIIEATSGYKKYHILMGSKYILIRATHTNNSIGVKYQFNTAGTDIVYIMGKIHISDDTWMFHKVD